MIKSVAGFGSGQESPHFWGRAGSPIGFLPLCDEFFNASCKLLWSATFSLPDIFHRKWRVDIEVINRLFRRLFISLPYSRDVLPPKLSSQTTIVGDCYRSRSEFRNYRDVILRSREPAHSRNNNITLRPGGDLNEREYLRKQSKHDSLVHQCFYVAVFSWKLRFGRVFSFIIIIIDEQICRREDAPRRHCIVRILVFINVNTTCVRSIRDHQSLLRGITIV